MNKGKLLGHGTASLIGPRIVLTAGHNCYPNGLNTSFDLEFVPAPIYKRNGIGFKVKGKYLPENFKQMFLPREYNKNPGFLFDYAVLELDTEYNLEECFGSFGYDFLQRQYEYQSTINKISIFGYPPSK